MKFLVFWKLEPETVIRVGPESAKMLFGLQDYAKELDGQGKLDCQYHIVGKHGGVWILNVASNEELERLIAKMPIYNFATFDIHPLTEMAKR
jgi:muconolactone delta-isomerase